jgi:hypothetical protein
MNYIVQSAIVIFIIGEARPFMFLCLMRPTCKQYELCVITIEKRFEQETAKGRESVQMVKIQNPALK